MSQAHRFHRNGFPVGEVIAAGPRMNFRVAVETGKASDLFPDQFPRRFVHRVALRAGKVDGVFGALGHPDNIIGKSTDSKGFRAATIKLPTSEWVSIAQRDLRDWMGDSSM
jgi:hypothetical protein